MNKWAKFYKNRVNSISYLKYFKEKYAPFLALIKENWNPLCHEEACGIGTVSKCLDNDGPMCMIDKSWDMINLCKENYLTKDKYPATFLAMDIRTPVDEFLQTNLIYSHGLLEHFTDHDIKYILDAQLMRCETLIHYVPTDGYNEPSFGDERLLPYQYWVDNFKPTEYHRFNDGKDLALLWRK